MALFHCLQYRHKMHDFRTISSHVLVFLTIFTFFSIPELLVSHLYWTNNEWDAAYSVPNFEYLGQGYSKSETKSKKCTQMSQRFLALNLTFRHHCCTWLLVLTVIGSGLLQWLCWMAVSYKWAEQFCFIIVVDNLICVKRPQWRTSNVF